MTLPVKGRIRAKDIDGEYEFEFVYSFYDATLDDFYFETPNGLSYTIRAEDILEWIR